MEHDYPTLFKGPERGDDTGQETTSAVPDTGTTTKGS
jgi:hypothetical protein